MTNTAPAGWYADPANPSVEHWWDGTRYNGSRATGAPVPPPPPPAAAAPPAQPVNVYVTVPGPGAAPAYVVQVSPKSRTVATILSFFLGVLGIDRFYLGNIGMGVAKLLVGWLTAGIWPLIDFIIIIAGSAHDGDGLPVRNWE